MGSSALDGARRDGFVTVGDTRLEIAFHPAKDESARTVVFLHEGLGSVRMWRDFPKKLVEALDMNGLVYSRAGYGRSDAIEPPRPLDYMQREGHETLPALLELFDLRNAILFGHSDGGSIALVAAGTAWARARIDALVLEAPHVFSEDLSTKSIERAREAFVHGDLRERLARHHGANVDGAFWGWNRAWLDPAFADWNIEAETRAVLQPTLIIQGEDDEYGTLAQLDAIEAAMGPRAERFVIPRAGHSPHRSHEALVIDRVARFLASRVGPLAGSGKAEERS